MAYMTEFDVRSFFVPSPLASFPHLGPISAGANACLLLTTELFQIDGFGGGLWLFLKGLTKGRRVLRPEDGMTELMQNISRYFEAQ